MCTVCGCGDNHQHPKPYLQMGRSATHKPLHYGDNEAGVTVPGLSSRKVIELEHDVLGRNNEVAVENRNHFANQHTAVLNLVSSPGSGKTTLLTETLKQLVGIPAWKIIANHPPAVSMSTIQKGSPKFLEFFTHNKGSPSILQVVAF